MANYVQDDALVSAIQEEIQRSIAEKQKAEGGKGIKLVVNGQEFTYKDDAELNSAVNGTLAEARKLLEQEKAARTELEARMVQLVERQEEEKKPQGSPDTFSVKRFQEMASQGEDGFLKALDYANNFTSLKTITEENKKLQARLASQETAMAASYFKSLHPEYVPTPENSKRLEEIRTSYGLPFDQRGLEAAYAIAKQNNILPDPVKQQVAGMLTQFQQNGGSIQYDPQGRPYLGPPPMGRGNQGQSEDEQWADIAESMTTDQIEATLYKLARNRNR
jgi:hypothetical protein